MERQRGPDNRHRTAPGEGPFKRHLSSACRRPPVDRRGGVDRFTWRMCCGLSGRDPHGVHFQTGGSPFPTGGSHSIHEPDPPI